MLSFFLKTLKYCLKSFFTTDWKEFERFSSGLSYLESSISTRSSGNSRLIEPSFSEMELILIPLMPLKIETKWFLLNALGNRGRSSTYGLEAELFSCFATLVFWFTIALNLLF